MKWGWVLCLILIGTMPIMGATARQYIQYSAAKSAYDQGHIADAVKQFTALVADDPENIVLVQNLANALYKQGQYDKAKRLYEQLLKQSPKSDYAMLWYNLGNCAYQTQRYDDAIRWYRKALVKSPNDTQAKHNLELALQRRQSPKTPPPPSPKSEDPPPQRAPDSLLNTLDQFEREARHNRSLNPAPPPKDIEKDW